MITPLQITPEDHIDLIIEHAGDGLFDHIDALCQYPIDAVISRHHKVNEDFIRPVGWATMSETEKVVKLLGWLKGQFDRNITVEFQTYDPVEYTLKYRVIGAMGYYEDKKK